MLVLTGTTGHLGSRVLNTLLSEHLVPASSLIISSSNVAKVPQIARDHGVEIRYGDFTDPASLSSSFKGTSALFLVSYPSPRVDRWEKHRAVIDAAKAAGVETVIYTSLMFGGETGMDSVAGVHLAHIKTIEYLEESGLRYVVLREGVYSETWWMYAGWQPRGGYETSKVDDGEIEFVIPNDGPVAFVSWDELGQATARILAEYGKYEGHTPALTGSEALTLTEVGRLVEKTTGRKVKVSIVGKEEAARYHKEKKSLPESSSWVIDSWSGWYDGIANGETAVVDPLLEQLLGKNPGV